MVHTDQFVVRLQQAMKDAGYVGHGSAARLSRELGVTPKAVAKWLHGESMPGFKRVAELAILLRIDPEWLLWGHHTDVSTSKTSAGIPIVSKHVDTMVRGKDGTFRPMRELAEIDPKPLDGWPDDHADVIPISPWDDDTPLDDDEVEVPFLREVELSAGSGRTVIQENSKAKLRFGKMTLRKHSVQFDQAVCVPVHGNSMEPVLPDGSTVAINKGATNIVDGKMYALSHGGQLRVKTLYRLPGGGLRLRSFNREEHADEEYSAEQIQETQLIVLGKVFWSAAFH